jgi:hypothetical protein
MDSISLLLSPPKTRTQGGSGQDGAEAAPKQKTAKSAKTQEAPRKDKAELEAFTRAIVDAINRRDWVRTF